MPTPTSTRSRAHDGNRVLRAFLILLYLNRHGVFDNVYPLYALIRLALDLPHDTPIPPGEGRTFGDSVGRNEHGAALPWVGVGEGRYLVWSPALLEQAKAYVAAKHAPRAAVAQLRARLRLKLLNQARRSAGENTS